MRSDKTTCLAPIDRLKCTAQDEIAETRGLDPYFVSGNRIVRYPLRSHEDLRRPKVG